MAFTKQEKRQIVAQYGEWIEKSKAVFVLEYSKMRMPDVNDARAKLRENDGSLHVVKNRLFKRVLDEKGYTYDENSSNPMAFNVDSSAKSSPALKTVAYA